MKEKHTYKETAILKNKIVNDEHEKNVGVDVGIYGEDSSPRISPNEGPPVSVGYKYVGGGMYEKEFRGSSSESRDEEEVKEPMGIIMGNDVSDADSGLHKGAQSMEIGNENTNRDPLYQKAVAMQELSAVNGDVNEKIYARGITNQ